MELFVMTSEERAEWFGPRASTNAAATTGKTKEVAFVRLMRLPPLLALLEADAHSAGATDARPRRSPFPRGSGDRTEGDPRSLRSQLPRSGSRVSPRWPGERRESLGCRASQRCRSGRRLLFFSFFFLHF